MSITASVTCASMAVWRRRWPASWSRSPSDGQRPCASHRAAHPPHADGRMVDRRSHGPPTGMVERRSAWVRTAGRLRLPDDAEVLWSMAEGAQGRRWRATSTLDGAVTHALLLEVGTDLRPTRLELTTAAGMLTLHPGHDRRVVEGNIVHPGGVRPLRYPWSAEHEF